jgi:hypothetical protein
MEGLRRDQRSLPGRSWEEDGVAVALCLEIDTPVDPHHKRPCEEDLKDANSDEDFAKW